MVRATVRLPELLARITGERTVEVEASDVGGAMEALLVAHPTLRPHLFDDRGGLRPNVLCAVDGEPTRLTYRSGRLRDGAEIVFVPSVAGG